MSTSFPQHGRLAGIDYGHVRVGIAVCDPERAIASPLATYTRRDPEADADFFRRLVDEEHLVGFVVGLPIHASGSESAKSGEARRFGKWLTQVTGRPVCYWDERYTTVEAEQLLLQAEVRKRGRKKRLDSVAAQILLAAFLESPQTDQQPPQPLDDTRESM
jgi:putative Holliday junction resolvase